MTKLQKIRQQRKISQEQAAVITGYGYPAYRNFEKGETEIMPLKAAMKLAKYFETTVEELFSDRL